MNKIFFKNKSGLKLCGIWHFPKNKTDKAIILAHGLTVDKEEQGIFEPLSNRLQENGYSVFRFDFRGHGESEGNSIDLRVDGEIEDLESTINYVKVEGYSEFGLLGASFGGGIVPLLSQNILNQISAICLWNPSLNYHHILLDPIVPHYIPFKKIWEKDLREKGYTEMGRVKVKIGKKLFDEMKILKPYEALKKIIMPTIIVHSIKDTYVPYEDSKEYVKFLENGELITIENLGHGFQEGDPENYKTNEAILKTLEFFKKHL